MKHRPGSAMPAIRAAAIAFAAIGFVPHVNPRVHFLPMVTRAGVDGGKSSICSWQGGVSHTPVSWGELVVAIEP